MKDPAQPTIQKTIACHLCGQVHAYPALRYGWRADCVRCGSRLMKRTRGSLQKTSAFIIAALVLFAPANIFPILRMNIYGATSENTVWEGCVRLYQTGDVLVAAVVFLASMFIPFLKILGLVFLVLSSHFEVERWRKPRTRIYKFIETIGRWAMLDVFVLAVLVSLVKLQRLATIIPGSGLLAFTGVVICTILASACFDPQLIWNSPEKEYD